ncbi:protein sda1 [Anaeramoeba flamelloides]|uniref:Protein SDA1 n=1 Tax=Anaeramoeba flamelloides TaxID=1746091 RepID=A0ABQ8X3U3_9EUKA|nr:protein sda1 [Anaeramoeba flamelloides]
MDLLTLQHNAKKQPESYKEEVEMQYEHFQSSLTLFLLNPTSYSKDFGLLLQFLSHMSPKYKKMLKDFPTKLSTLLNDHSRNMHKELRMTIIKSLFLLENKGCLPLENTLPIYFSLFACKDKELNKLVTAHILRSFRMLSKKNGGNKRVRIIKNIVYSFLKDTRDRVPEHALLILILTFNKKIWYGAQTVNIIANACFQGNTRLLVASLNFFLKNDIEEYLDPDLEEKETEETSKLQAAQESYCETLKSMKYSKKTKKKKHKKRKLLQEVRMEQKRLRYSSGSTQINLKAIELLYDPQSFSEKLFGYLRTCTETFRVKILMMNVIARLIGVHKLLIFNYYTWVQKYAKPHQEGVTEILGFIVQSVHNLVPPEIVEPILNHLLLNFIGDRSSTQAVVVGINTVLEIVKRCPLVLTEEVARDIAEYKRSRDKYIGSAARGFIHLVREIDPKILPKKDRGKTSEGLEKNNMAYGEEKVNYGVEGIELLGLGDNVDKNKILTDEDFFKLEKIKFAIKMGYKKNEEGKYINEDEDVLELEEIWDLRDEDDDVEEDLDIVKNREFNRFSHRRFDPNDLMSNIKRKRTREERMEIANEGKVGRTYGKPKASGGGTKNEEKEKLKPFMLTRDRHVVVEKKLLSSKERDRIRNKNILKLQKRK